jgi:hypothetical protein
VTDVSVFKEEHYPFSRSSLENGRNVSAEFSCDNADHSLADNHELASYGGVTASLKREGLMELPLF